MDPLELRGQAAIVSGASRGLGRAVALELATRGVRLAVCSRRADQIDRVAREIRGNGGDAISVPVDVRNWKFVERGIAVMRGHLGAVDILINAAAAGWEKPFEEWEVDEIDLVLELNLRGVAYMTRSVIGEMLAAGRGQVVNVSTGAGSTASAVAAAAAGVAGFSRALSSEVAAAGVHVVNVAWEAPRDAEDSACATAARALADVLERPASGLTEIVLPER